MSGESDPVNDLDVSVSENLAQEVLGLTTCEDVHPLSTGYFSTKFRNAGEWVASRPWGQIVFKSIDRVLWCIERTLLWQHPNAVPDKLSPMDRPVNLLIAYPLAALLWVFQHVMFLGAETEDSPKAVLLVAWVRTRRRRLRALRFLGIRNMRRDNVLGCPVLSGPFAQVSWFLGLLPACKNVEEYESKDANKGEEEMKSLEKSDSELKKKRRYSDVSITADEAVFSLDDYHSESDSDYMPDNYHTSDSSDSEDLSVDEDAEDDEGADKAEEDVHAEEKTEDEGAEKDGCQLNADVDQTDLKKTEEETKTDE